MLLTLSLRLSRGVHTVSPVWFRSHVLPAHGGSWQQAEAELWADPYEARRMRELEDTLRAEGIQRPLNLYYDHWWSRRPTVADGMHRAIVAMRLGMEIPVARDYQHSAGHPPTDVYRVTAAAGVPVADLLSAVVSLASFRLSSGPWIQTDTAAGVGDHAVEVYLPCHPALRAQIVHELEKRLCASDIDARVEFRCNEINWGA